MIVDKQRILFDKGVLLTWSKYIPLHINCFLLKELLAENAVLAAKALTLVLS